MVLHLISQPGDEQSARWWPHFRDVVSPHRHDLSINRSINLFFSVVCSTVEPNREKESRLEDEMIRVMEQKDQLASQTAGGMTHYRMCYLGCSFTRV
jgi:hypothetical protein